MDGKLKYIHVAWIPAIHAGMTSLENLEHLKSDKVELTLQHKSQAVSSIGSDHLQTPCILRMRDKPIKAPIVVFTSSGLHPKAALDL